MQTDSIGDYLQQEYGSKPPDTHIECFYIRLGQEIANIQQQAVDILIDILDPTLWRKTGPGWDGVLFFKAPVSTRNTKREHEAEINDTIRWPLMAKLREQGPDIHVMFSRACLYTENKKRATCSSHEITTENIGEIMKSVYENDAAGNTHIGYFYLFVQAVIDGKCLQIIGDIDVYSKALEELKQLPGDWKCVKPRTTWPGTFFGLFPKGMQEMNEREREKILNGEVRMPLIERLEAKLINATPRGGSKIKVQVIITRACKYTPEEMDTS